MTHLEKYEKLLRELWTLIHQGKRDSPEAEVIEAGMVWLEEILSRTDIQKMNALSANLAKEVID